MPRVPQLVAIIATGAVALAVAAAAVISALGALERPARQQAETGYIARLTAIALDRAAGGAPAPATNLPAPAAVLSHQPLDGDAFTRAALTAAVVGHDAQAHDLMTELLRRDPRSQPARLWLLKTAALAHDWPAAVGQLDRLLALDPQSSDRYVPALAGIAMQPGGEQPIARLLARNPPWRGPLLGYLTLHGGGRNLIFRLVSGPAAASKVDPSVAQSGLLMSMLQKGDYDGAYLAWINFLPQGALAKVTPVYDGDFAGLPGPQPFNWAFNDSDMVQVGIEPGQGMKVDYDATHSVRIASQVLMLTPGAHRFDYVAHGSGGGDGADSGAIAWRILCLPANTVVLDAPVAGLTDRPVARSAPFAIPDNCGAQLLALEGTSGTFPMTRAIWFTHIAAGAVK